MDMIYKIDISNLKPIDLKQLSKILDSKESIIVCGRPVKIEKMKVICDE